MTFFHRTKCDAVETILTRGFVDGEGHYLLEEFTIRGVFVSDEVLDEGGGQCGAVLAIELDGDASAFKEYELVEEGNPYREWCVPASLLNQGRRRELSGGEIEEYSKGH